MTARVRRQRHFVGGHYYPLDVKRALSELGEHYIAQCVARARRNPRSARNELARRARRQLERERGTIGPGGRAGLVARVERRGEPR